MPQVANQANWGNPLVEVGLTGALDVSATVFTTISPIKEDSSSLKTTPGTPLKIYREGHALVQQKQNVSEYVFECSMFLLSGASKPIADTNGVILPNYTLRLTPEDNTMPGFIMRKCNVSVEEGWTSKEGKLLKYTFTGLLPVSGNICEDYTKP